MKTLLGTLTALALIGCGAPVQVAQTCPSEIYESVGLEAGLSCSEVVPKVEAAIHELKARGTVPEAFSFKQVRIYVANADTVDCGLQAYGCTEAGLDGRWTITLNRSLWSAAHEPLHYYDQKTYNPPADGLHHNWTTHGFWDADSAFKAELAAEGVQAP